MRRYAVLLTALTAMIGAPAHAEPAPSSTDVLVWAATASGYETKWIRVDGDSTEVVARRSEAVASNGTTLWALRFTWKRVDLLPCSALEDEDTKAEPAGSADLPGLAAVPLNGGKAVTIVEASAAGGGYGEVWGNTITLQGGSGARVSVHRTDSGFGCGAHGYADSYSSLWDLAKGDRSELEASAFDGLRKKAAGPIMADVDKQDCRDEDMDPDAPDEARIHFSGVSVAFDGDKVLGEYTFVHPTGADWNFVCEIEGTVQGPLLPATGLAAPDAAVGKALLTAGVGGAVGYAPLSLRGEARDKALAAFKDAKGIPAPPKVEPAKPAGTLKELIDAGRKATQAKDYAGAIASFGQAIDKDAKAARAWSGRGYARLLAEDLASAKQDLDKALTLDADPAFQAAVWYNLGLVAEKQGDKDAALAAYGKANTLKPSKAAKGKLESLR